MARGIASADLVVALARLIPVAEDITIESDSGGHTDNRPAGPLFVRIKNLAEQLAREHNYQQVPRLGIAGDLALDVAISAITKGEISSAIVGAVELATDQVHGQAVGELIGQPPENHGNLSEYDRSLTEIKPTKP